MRWLGITGPAAVGKSTVARAIQEMSTQPWLLYEVDRCQPSTPPQASFATVENDRALRRANLAATRAYVDNGFRVIAEMDLADDPASCLTTVLAGIAATAVTLVADRDEVLRRARERGDDLSWVARHFDRIDWHARRGLVIDTTTRSPAEVAAEVIERTDADSE